MVSQAPELLEQDGNIEPEIDAAPDEEIAPVEDEVGAAPDEEESVQGQAPRGIEDLSDEELQENERVREMIRRREQAARDRLQYDAEVQRAQERAQWLAQGGHVNDAAAAVTLDENGQIQVNRDRMADIVAKMDRASTDRAASSAFMALDTVAPFRQLPVDAQRRITEASNAGRDWVGIYLETAAERLAEAKVEAAKPKWEKEYKARMAKQQEAQTRKAADATNATAPRPTAAGGAPAKRYNTFDEVEEAYLEGEIPHAQYKKYAEQFGVALA